MFPNSIVREVHPPTWQHNILDRIALQRQDVIGTSDSLIAPDDSQSGLAFMSRRSVGLLMLSLMSSMTKSGDMTAPAFEYIRYSATSPRISFLLLR
jgi:hypothetical protein